MLRFDARYGLLFDDLLQEMHSFISVSRDKRDRDLAIAFGMLRAGIMVDHDISPIAASSSLFTDMFTRTKQVSLNITWTNLAANIGFPRRLFPKSQT